MIRIAEIPSNTSGGGDGGGEPHSPNFTATRNACKLCTPLGACLAFNGVEGCVPLLHGSQGCATYIRRYTISHFREPMDIASSSFSEESAIFGGEKDLHKGLDNVVRGYSPAMVGVATTCLSETIGDDVAMIVRRYREARAAASSVNMPHIVHVATPSYTGTHAEGYHAAVRGMVAQLAKPGERRSDSVNLITGMISPADIRHLQDIAAAFGLDATLLPDYADRMDGGTWAEYRRIPPGGTPVSRIEAMGSAAATIQMGATTYEKQTAGDVLESMGVPLHAMALPIGVRLNDAMFDSLASVTGGEKPQRYEAERARLIDAYVDAHKYLFGQRVAIYGEADLVVSLAAFCCEIGLIPVIAATGASGNGFESAIREIVPDLPEETRIAAGVDFEEIESMLNGVEVDLALGNSKGCGLARRRGVPLVRVGFPVHDRFGAARIMHVGYAGTQQLFDRIVNALLERKQDESDPPYSYL